MCCKNTNFILKPDILCLKISEKEKQFLIFADFCEQVYVIQEQAFEEVLTNISPVGKKFPEERTLTDGTTPTSSRATPSMSLMSATRRTCTSSPVFVRFIAVSVT